MNDIEQRFAALPRGRKGGKAVVIVEETELACLINDARERERQVNFDHARRMISVGEAPPYLLADWASSDPHS